MLDIPKVKFSVLSMDWTELPPVKDKRGNVYDFVLTVTDRATKYVILIPCNKKQTAEELAEVFFHEVVRHHGLPRSIISDRDTRFMGHFWQALT